MKKSILIINIISAICLILCFFFRNTSPETNILFALIPFAFFILLAINIVFFVFWLIVKWKFTLISLISIIITFSNIINFLPIKSYLSFENKDSTYAKIMSYNVNVFGLYNWHNTKIKPNILKIISEENPDILCLQEAFWSGDKNYFITIDSILINLKTKHSYQFALSTAIGKQNFGLVIISKYKIINSYSEKFEASNNGFCFVDILKDKDTVRIYNLHLQSMGLVQDDYTKIEKISNVDSLTADIKDASGLLKKYLESCKLRIKQAEVVRQNINDCKYPLIVCGDFNDFPLSYTYNTIRNDLKDAYLQRGNIKDYTWKYNKLKLRIDNIFYSDNFKCQKYYIIKQDFSDHYAVVALLTNI